MKAFQYFLFFIALTTQTVLAQDNDPKVIDPNVNQRVKDDKSQTDILIGLCNREGLQSDLFNSFYEKEYNAYSPETKTMDLIKKNPKLYNIIIYMVMGSWCEDSQQQVPRFFKIIDQIAFDENDMTVFCVDRNKKTPKNETDQYNITLVPTFIFYYHGNEIGRIIEKPKVSLEKDFLSFLESIDKKSEPIKKTTTNTKTGTTTQNKTTTPKSTTNKTGTGIKK
jgi:thiol-disulfide isomerase/thioredoxin